MPMMELIKLDRLASTPILAVSIPYCANFLLNSGDKMLIPGIGSPLLVYISDFKCKNSLAIAAANAILPSIPFSATRFITFVKSTPVFAKE